MKSLKAFLIVVVSFFIAGVIVQFSLPKIDKPLWVLTYSPAHARYLGFGAIDLYRQIISDYKPKHVRLQASWNEIEKHPGKFEWSELDEILQITKESGATATLAIGRKLPRWPECHDPAWLKAMHAWEVEDYQHKMITAAVEHFKDNKTITRWQLENEPMFMFGECPSPSFGLLKRERDWLKKLDPTRQILMTDSGELSPWLETAYLADIQGVTMYRVTWNPITGFFTYPLPAWFYRVKAALVSPFVDKVVVSELQLEPWAPYGLANLSLADSYKSLDHDRFFKNVEYFKKTGLSEGFVWGVEWWYMAKRQGDDWYFKQGQELFK